MFIKNSKLLLLLVFCSIFFSHDSIAISINSKTLKSGLYKTVIFGATVLCLVQSYRIYRRVNKKLIYGLFVGSQIGLNLLAIAACTQALKELNDANDSADQNSFESEQY